MKHTMKHPMPFVWMYGLALLWLTLGPLRASDQAVSVWPAGTPALFLQGPTLEATLRNGVQASSDRARFTAHTASALGRRAKGGGYQMQNLRADYQNLEMQFQNLCTTFHAVANLALQLRNPRAANAAAELEAGLDIISEAFDPVQRELQTGTVNSDTVVRMCQVLEEALLVWEKELKRCSLRLATMR